MAPASTARRKDAPSEVELLDLAPDTDTLLSDVVEGLSADPKTLPCKYFYDAQGAELFEQICELPEYYPTRTELRILRENLPDMAALIGPDAAVIEPGSGSGIKTRLLLEALERPAAYTPIDVSRDQLIDYAGELATDYPALDILPVCADFTAAIELPAGIQNADNKLIYFPGSTIGNFAPDEAVDLLTGWRDLLGGSGKLLLGVDLKKDQDTLEAAYNDSQGITAAFNLNLLARINRELDADFDLDAFEHRADYDGVSGAIRMWLVSQRPQQVRLNGSEQLVFGEQEAICTEHSYKYSEADIDQLTSRAGWQAEQRWLDDERHFAVQYLSTY